MRPAPKIFKETCRIDWTQSTEHIYNLIRGLSPYPAAWSELYSPNGEKNILKIYESKKAIEKNPSERAGTIKTDGKHYFRIATGDGYIDILQLQLPGRKKMTVEEFLRGHNIMNYLCSQKCFSSALIQLILSYFQENIFSNNHPFLCCQIFLFPLNKIYLKFFHQL